MNAQNAHLYLPLVQALAEGKTIQIKRSHEAGWVSISCPSFDIDPANYRIKPPPLECWVNFYQNSKPFSHPTREIAEQECGSNGRTVRMIEAPEQ